MLRDSCRPVKSFRAQLLAYVGIAGATVAPSLFRAGAMTGDGVDAWGTWWFYWWIRRCVEHGANPGWTDYFFYPTGKDILAHTGNNFVDAVFSIPFQWVFGPDHYFPIFCLALLVSNALAFRPLAREVLGEEGVFSASLLWMVNPYSLFELTAGRPTQSWMAWTPIAFYLFLRVCRAPGWRDAVFLGLAVAVTGWTYWFAGFFLAFGLAVLAPFELRRRALAPMALAAGVCLVVVAPAVWLMGGAWAAGEVPGSTLPAGSIFEPPKAVANNVATDLHGLLLMERKGAPLFTQPAWLLGLGLALFRARLGRWWAVLGLLALLAVGPVVHLGEKTIVLPWYMVLYRHLPFFSRLWFPYRLAGTAFVAAALLVAAALPRRPWLLWGLVLVGLAGQARYDTWPANWKDVRSPGMLLEIAREPRRGLIFVPLRIQHEGLLWQTAFDLPTFGGMGESAPAMWPPDWRRRLDNPLIRSLRTAAMGPGAGPAPEQARKQLVDQGFRWVVLRRDLVEMELDRAGKGGKVADVERAVQGVMGRAPDGVDGALLLWDLEARWVAPPAWAPTPAHLAADWARPDSPAWERGLAEAGRKGRE